MNRVVEKFDYKLCISRCALKDFHSSRRALRT